MEKTSIKFGNIEVKKKKICLYKKSISIKKYR